MAEFKMPSLGADMEEGTLVEWLAKPGERIERGTLLAAVETQKGLFEIESFEDGILGPPLVQPGQTVPVGTVLAMIQTDGAAIASAEAPRRPRLSANRMRHRQRSSLRSVPHLRPRPPPGELPPPPRPANGRRNSPWISPTFKVAVRMAPFNSAMWNGRHNPRREKLGRPRQRRLPAPPGKGCGRPSRRP